ncbi:hypothetical protein UQW22_15500 [Isoptericola halotolerans]
MIEAQSLTKRYGATTAVDGVDFTVRPAPTSVPWWSPCSGRW